MHREVFFWQVGGRWTGLKRAFLFNFARSVEWSTAAFAGPDDSVLVCVVGGDSFADVIVRTVSGRSVEGRPVAVVALDALSGLSSCPILFVGEKISSDPGNVASSVSGLSIFTVVDHKGFAAGGGIANFIQMDNKVRFEINPSAEKKAGLKVSSLLLRLAKVVK